jgi:uncharacterized protein
MKIERANKKELLTRIKTSRGLIQVVVGARQIGKTTLIQQVLDDIKQASISVTADDVSENQTFWINQQWEAARIQLQESKSKFLILAIDEIQKIHHWSEAVKKNWDADTKNSVDIRLILSGSSKLLIQNGLTESLAGRFELIKMTHWSFTEMQEAFDFTEDQYAYFGAYPGSADMIKNEARWNSYIKDSLIETTISKDILMLTRIDKPALLKQLFELSCAYSTQELSYTKIMGQLQNAGNTTTLSNYITLLDSAQLVTSLNKYSGSQTMQRNSTPKFQVYNNAFYSVYSKTNFKDANKNPALWGRWIESIIGTHLINSATQHDMQLFYWRKGNDEVDFILQHEKKIIAIEVKSGNRMKSSGLEKANQIYHFYKIILVGIDGLDWKKFIQLDLRKLFM